MNGLAIAAIAWLILSPAIAVATGRWLRRCREAAERQDAALPGQDQL